MFGLFSKNDTHIDKKRPTSYEGIVNQQEYETILDYALEHLKPIAEIVSVKDGTIMIKKASKPEEEMQCHLDNLVRRCKNEDKKDWQDIVNHHFNRMSIDPHKTKYIYKDFDFAQSMVKFVVRHESTFDKKMGFVCRVDLQGTFTFLVLDTDEAFQYIRKQDIKEWEKTEEELFEIAFENVAAEKIEINQFHWKEQFEAYAFFSGDFSASYIVDLEKNAPFAIGKYGSVVAIPTKGSAIVHPLNGATALDFIVSFYETLTSFFTEDEVPISNRYYWYYKGRFQLFEEREDKGKIVVSLPQKLEQLLKGTPSV